MIYEPAVKAHSNVEKGQIEITLFHKHLLRAVVYHKVHQQREYKDEKAQLPPSRSSFSLGRPGEIIRRQLWKWTYRHTGSTDAPRWVPNSLTDSIVHRDSFSSWPESATAKKKKELPGTKQSGSKRVGHEWTIQWQVVRHGKVNPATSRRLLWTVKGIWNFLLEVESYQKF